MGSLGRMNRAERFIYHFQQRATADVPLGTKWCLESCRLEQRDSDDCVYLVYTFRNLEDPSKTLTLSSPEVYFDPERDIDFEFEDAAIMLGYDLDDEQDLTAAEAAFQKAGLL